MLRRLIVLLSLIVVGAILVALPDLVESGLDWRTLSGNIGIAVLIAAAATILSDFLDGTLARDSASSLNNAQVLHTRQEAEAQIAELLRNARSVKIIATCLHSFQAQYGETIHKRFEANGEPSVHIIVMDPGADSLRNQATMDRALEVTEDDELIAQWKAAIASLVRMGQVRRGVHVGLNPFHPVGSLFIFDDILYVTPYAFGSRGSMSPTISLTRQSAPAAFRSYETSFETMWDFITTRGNSVVAP